MLFRSPSRFFKTVCMDFLVTILNLCLSFSPAERFTDVVMDFCYVSMFCNFDLIKKIGLL